MSLIVVDQCSEAALGAPVNEDAIGSGPSSAWVIDGATSAHRPELDPVSDARWHSSRLSAALGDQFARGAGDPGAALAGAIRAAASDASGAFASSTPPSSAVAVVTVDGPRGEVAALGDITVLCAGPGAGDAVQALRAPGRTATERRYIAQYAALRAAGRSREEAQDELLAEMEQRRGRLMNQDGGYWIASLDPAAAEHAVRHSFRAAAGTRILLASDGFAAVDDTFGLHADWADVLAGRVPLREVVNQVRAAERADLDCIAFPRLKPSDDASALLVEVRAP